MKNILIIKCGETFPDIKEKYGDFEDWVIKRSNLPADLFKVFNIPKGEQLRHPSEYSATIITGSHANVNQRLPWIKQLKNWIVTAKYSNIPVLGICFGHQVIAEALGGKVELNHDGPARGAVNVKLTRAGQQDPLFRRINDSFESYSLHSYSVANLPMGAELLAQSKGMIESFRVEKIYGVQFHPEFNEEIMKTYARLLKHESGSKVRAKIKSAFKNQSIISNFVDIALKT